MYSEIFDLHSNLLKALAHPKRLEIIHLLRDQKLAVTDIHQMLDLPQANISQHLMILRDAGVVKTKREGKQIIYSLTNKKIIKASDLLREVLIDQSHNLNLANGLTLKMKDLVPIVHDPVCGMRVSPKTAGFHYRHNNNDYYFCASGCLKTFKKRPAKYDSNKQ
ncbi:MAG: metalloregulator ArsR/SmtB family transcription factor [Patescibacteria group bacterium]